MDLLKIVNQIKVGKLFIEGNSLLTKEQHDKYIKANAQAEYYDMLQGVRKVLL